MCWLLVPPLQVDGDGDDVHILSEPNTPHFPEAVQRLTRSISASLGCPGDMDDNTAVTSPIEVVPLIPDALNLEEEDEEAGEGEGEGERGGDALENDEALEGCADETRIEAEESKADATNSTTTEDVAGQVLIDAECETSSSTRIDRRFYKCRGTGRVLWMTFSELAEYTQHTQRFQYSEIAPDDVPADSRPLPDTLSVRIKLLATVTGMSEETWKMYISYANAHPDGNPDHHTEPFLNNAAVTSFLGRPRHGLVVSARTDITWSLAPHLSPLMSDCVDLFLEVEGNDAEDGAMELVPLVPRACFTVRGPPTPNLEKLAAKVAENDNLQDLFTSVFMSWPSRPFLGRMVGTRSVWETFRTVHQRASAFARHLDAIIPRLTGSTAPRRVGFISPNTTTLLQAVYGAVLARITTVVINPTNSPEVTAGIIAKCNLSDVFVAEGNEGKTAIAGTDVATHPLSRAMMDDLTGVYSTDPYLSEPDPFYDTVMIVFTSGSTAAPKGLQVDVDMFLYRMKRAIRPREHGDSRGRCLVITGPFSAGAPLRSAMIPSLTGGRILCEPIPVSFEWFQSTGPTAVSMVPQMWNLFCKWLDTLDQVDQSATLGPRIVHLNCGGAAPIPAIMQRLKDTFPGTLVTENFACSEAGSITFQSPGEPAGRLADGVKIKLVDYEHFKSSDKPFPRGELWVKTQTMSRKGYLDMEQNRLAFTEDGWYRTGDVVELVDKDHLRVIDRCKNFFKVQTGEFVSPESVEKKILSAVPRIAQLAVFGSSSVDRVVAVAVLVVRDGDGDGDGHGRITTSPLQDDAVALQLEIALRAGNVLRDFEIPGAVLISPPFTSANQMLTHTGKISRWRIKEIYSAEITAMLDAVKSGAGAGAGAGSGTGTVAGSGDSIVTSGTIQDVLIAAVDSFMAHGIVDDEAHQKWGVVEAHHSSSMRAMIVKDVIEFQWSVRLPVTALLDKPLQEIVFLITGSATPTMDCDVDLWDEANLPSDVTDAATSAPPLSDTPPLSSRVLLTGSTGFLGAAILSELIKDKTIETILCGVRPGMGECADVAVKLGMSMMARGYWTKDQAEDIQRPGRVVVVSMNLSAPRLGLSDDDVSKLGAIHRVIHAGARVDHLRPYTALKPSNVDGTTELLRVLLQSGQQFRSFTFVSTASVLPIGAPSNSSDDVCLEALQRRHGGYSQTKIVSELRLKAAAAVGACHVVVVRPGMIGPDGSVPSVNASDWIMRFVRGVTMVGAYRTPKHTILHLTPVNDCAKAIVALSTQSTGCPPAVVIPQTMHVPTMTFMSTVVKALQQLSKGKASLRFVSDAEWDTIVADIKADNPMTPLKHRYSKGLQGTSARAGSPSQVLDSLLVSATLGGYTVAETSTWLSGLLGPDGGATAAATAAATTIAGSAAAASGVSGAASSSLVGSVCQTKKCVLL